jgi:hypothetical protein
MMKFSIVGFGFMGEMHAQIYQALLDVEIATLVAIEIEGTKHKLLSIAVEIPVSATHSAFLVIEDAALICALNLFAVARTDFTNRKKQPTYSTQGLNTRCTQSTRESHVFVKEVKVTC